MKTWMAVMGLALAAPAWAQEGQPPKPEAPPGKQEEDEDLTPEKALELLKETRDLMAKAEELLNESSRGKAVETEKAIVERINELLKDEPEAAQKKVLEKIERLMSKSQGKQKGAMEKIDEILRKAKSGQGQPQPGQPQKGPPQQQQGMKPQPQQPSDPARQPYDPNRNDPANVFRSKGDRSGRWGDLPPRVREAMFSGKRDLDDFPPEYQQLLKEYFQGLLNEKQ